MACDDMTAERTRKGCSERKVFGCEITFLLRDRNAIHHAIETQLTPRDAP